MNGEGSGESGESLTIDGSSIQAIEQVKFLESLTSHYESLVQDMNKELLSCQKDVKSYSNETRSQSGIPSDNLEPDFEPFQSELCRRETVIEYLREQLVLSRKSKEILKTLWQSSVQQVEEMEVKKASCFKTGSNSPSPDFIAKWKALQTYSSDLETRLQKSSNDNRFYRNKIMEIRVEHDKALTKQVRDKVIEIEQVKSSFAKEIKHLRSSLANLGQNYKESLDKQVKAERETWEFQEHAKLQSIKLNVERLVLDNEALLKRNVEQMTLIMKMEADIPINPIRSIKIPPKTPSPTPENRTRGREFQGIVTIELENTKCQSIQTDFDYIHPDQFLQLQISQQQLDVEYHSMVAKLKVSEMDSLARINQLQCRIHQLENLNSNLQRQLMQLDEGNVSLTKHLSAPVKVNIKPEIESQKLTKLSSENNATSPWKEDYPQTKGQVEDCKLQLKIINLDRQLRQLYSDRIDLLDVIEKQTLIASKWKAEFRNLAIRLIP